MEGKDKGQGEETKEKGVKVKPRPSRLEGSCIFNSLKCSRAKRGGDVSPSNLSPVSQITQPAQPTSPIADHVVLADQIPPQENSVSAQGVVSDSVPPLVSFNDIQLPDYLEKYLPKKPARPELGKEKQQLNSEVSFSFSVYPLFCLNLSNLGLRTLVISFVRLDSHSV